MFLGKIINTVCSLPDSTQVQHKLMQVTNYNNFKDSKIYTSIYQWEKQWLYKVMTITHMDLKSKVVFLFIYY